MSVQVSHQSSRDPYYFLAWFSSVTTKLNPSYSIYIVYTIYTTVHIQYYYIECICQYRVWYIQYQYMPIFISIIHYTTHPYNIYALYYTSNPSPDLAEHGNICHCRSLIECKLSPSDNSMVGDREYSIVYIIYTKQRQQYYNLYMQHSSNIPLGDNDVNKSCLFANINKLAPASFS